MEPSPTYFMANKTNISTKAVFLCQKFPIQWGDCWSGGY